MLVCEGVVGVGMGGEGVGVVMGGEGVSVGMRGRGCRCWYGGRMKWLVWGEGL